MSYRFLHENLALRRLTGRPRTVLDIGCGAGLNGAVLRGRGARVTGVERDETSAHGARTRLDELVLVDLETESSLAAVLADRTFDLVLLADVLEHTRDPLRALREATAHLEEGGHVFVSLPNIAAWTVRKELLAGRFNYEDAGILDRTHLRFFTRTSAERMFDEAGLEVLTRDLTPHLTRPLLRARLAHSAADVLDEPSQEVDLHRDPMFAMYGAFALPIERAVANLAPNLLAFQNVWLARKPLRKRSLSVLVGMLTKDEEASIEPMIGAIRETLPDAKIVCVDSSTHDRTPDRARDLGATVLRQIPARGHGPAMERLLYHAASSGADALLMLDCDGTYPASELRTIRALLEGGADVVNAARTSRKPAAMPLANYLANRTFAGAASALHRVPTVDVHSGMRGYRTSMLRAFNFDGEGDALPVETLLGPVRRGYHVVEFPIDYRERVGDSKLRKLSGTAWTFARLLTAFASGSRGPRRFTKIPEKP